jgi:methyl-accepting chemotaxis protein
MGCVFAAINVNTIRFGGPLSSNSSAAADLVADILPPPAYIIEAHLVVSSLLRHPDKIAEKSEALLALEKDFEARQVHWSAAGLPSDIVTSLSASAVPARAYYTEVQSGFLPAMRSGDMATAQASFARLEKLYGQHRHLIDQLVKQSGAYQASLAQSANRSVSRSLIVLGSLGCIFLAALMLGIVRLGSRVVVPIERTAEMMHRMAHGDLDIEIVGKSRRDEIGTMAAAVGRFRQAAIEQRQTQAHIHAASIEQQQIVSEMARALSALARGDLSYRIDAHFPDQYEALRRDYHAAGDALTRALDSVARTAESINTDAAEISAASEDLAIRTEQQAANLEEAADAVAATAVALAQTAEGAQHVSLAIAEADQGASRGGVVVDQAVAAMAEIEKSSLEIAQIINVIEGIAFQTNLLALNAGVEAARAGDSGKGFAVVANEVRALAQRTTNAANDIKLLISESSRQVKNGVDLVAQAGDVLTRIGGEISEISGLAVSISQSAASQAQNMGAVNVTVGQMDRMTQQNAAMVEESTAASRSLKDEARHLTNLVQGFQLEAMATDTIGTRIRARAA